MGKNWRPGKLEFRIQEIARSEASKQLLRVPYDVFAKAMRKYLRWEAFALWVRAVLRFENEIPPVACKALEKRCAGLVKRDCLSVEPVLLSGQLDEWIHEHLFRRPRREQWFEAVVFYAVRDPWLKFVYTYWEQCECEWASKHQRRYPEFEAWLQSACDCPSLPVDAKRLARTVDTYLDWLSLVFWLAPFLENGLAIPSRIDGEIRRKGPQFCEIAEWLESKQQYQIATRFHLIECIESRFFMKAQQGNWFESVRHHAHNHPRYERISAYASRYAAKQSQPLLKHYPSFKNWCSEAESFVES